MANSKKPRKRHNRNLRMVRASDNLAKGSLFICVPYLGEKGNIIIHNNKPVFKGSISERDFNLLYGVSRPWGFIFGTYNRAPNGKTYVSYDLMNTTNQIALAEHNNWLVEMMKAQGEKVNKEHILSPFFIAIPNRIDDIADEAVIGMLEPLKIEEILITRYEENDLGEKAAQELAALPVIGDDRAWSILKQNNISNWRDVRALGFGKLTDFKGIGEKRAKALLDVYVALVNNRRKNGELVNYLKLESHTAQQNEVIAHLEATNAWSLQND